MLGVSCLNVGMLNEGCFGQKQDEKVVTLAGWVCTWLNEAYHGEWAVVGLNELHPSIAQKLRNLLQRDFHLGMASCDSNHLIWHVCVCV